MLKLKLQYFGHLIWTGDSLEKSLILAKIEGKEKRALEDDVVGKCHQCNGHELGQTSGDGKEQQCLVCCSSWGCKEWHNWASEHHHHHGSRASILQRSAFFMVQHSHLFMTTGKTIPLTWWTFVGKVMSLLFNMLSSFFIAFLSRSNCLLISWLQSPSAVILEPPKIKSLTVSIVSPSICCEVVGPDAMILVFGMLNFKPAFSLLCFTFIRRL